MAFLLSRFFILCFLFLASCGNSLILENYKLSIRSLMDTNKVVMSCNLRGQNLGEQTLSVGSFYTVDIPIIVKGDNRVFCDAKVLGSSAHGNFEMFNFDRDRYICDGGSTLKGTKTCNWQIQCLGMCFNVGGSCHLVLDWSTKIC